MHTTTGSIGGVSILDIAQRELRSSEKLIWADQPGPMARARTKIKVCLFGIPFTGFAIFWMSGAVGAGAPPLFAMFGIPFIAVGLGLILSPLWSYIEAQRWMVYAITDQRCLILRLFPVHKAESFGPGEITRLERTEKSDGSGNIIFSEDVKRGRRGSYLVPRGFYGITEVRRIEEEIEKLKQRGQQSA